MLMDGLFICMIPNNIDVHCKIDKEGLEKVNSDLVFSKKPAHYE